MELPKTLTDKQEAFNAAWLGLKSQGFELSVDINGICRYRGQNGLKCALGWCVPDDMYNPKIEGWGARDLLLSICEQTDVLFFDKLQICHDYAKDPSDMERRLRDLAKDYNLTIPEGDENGN